MYYRGLKENVKNKIMRIRANIANLPNFIKAAIEINDKLYKRQIKKRHSRNYCGRSGYAPEGRSGGQQRRDPNAIK